MRAFVAIGVVALVLVACAPGPAAPSPSPSVRTSPTAGATPSVLPTLAASASATPVDLPPVGELLPSTLDGVELHTFEVARDLLVRLAASAGVAVEELEVAYASEHGARFIQALAVRSPSVPADRLLGLLPDAAYGDAASEELSTRTEVLGGRDALIVEDPALTPRLGIFHGLVDGGALIMIQAFTTADAEAMISALPDR